jgi:hypothetical protein
VFIDAVTSDDNKLPVPVRQNIANLGVFVLLGIHYPLDGAR